MKIAVVAMEKALPSIQKTFQNQRCVGVEFEYYPTADEVLASIETRGFYMDKLVVITSLFENADIISKQTFISRVLQICSSLPSTSEIYLVDSKKIFESEYANQLAVYPQVIYQSQQIHVSSLFNIITGNIKEQESELTDTTAKPQGFLSRIFSRNKSILNNQGIPEESTEESQSDAPLFTDEPQPVSQEQQNTQANSQEDDLFNLFGDTDETELEPAPEYDDTPLFTDPEPEPEPRTDDAIPFHEPEPVLESIPTPAPAPAPVPVQKKQQKPQKPANPAKPDTPVKHKSKSNYVSIFQKRTKLIVCTGERRSGVSSMMSNMAQQAANDGLSVLVVDLDFERRGQAINFPFEANEEDAILSYSLFRAANAPATVADCAIDLGGGLYFLGTTLAVSDTSNIRKTVVDENMRMLLSAALAEYDMIFIDCPYEQLKIYPALINMSHIIIHSMMTDYRSVINTLNAITPDEFDSEITYTLYLSKVMLLLNNFQVHKWNNKELNEKNITNYMSFLTGESFYQNLEVLGRVPSIPDYDNTMSCGLLLVSDKRYQSIFIDLLNGLAERG